MTSIIDRYYRKIEDNVDNSKIKFDISSTIIES